MPDLTWIPRRPAGRFFARMRPTPSALKTPRGPNPAVALSDALRLCPPCGTLPPMATNEKLNDRLDALRTRHAQAEAGGGTERRKRQHGRCNNRQTRNHHYSPKRQLTRF